MHCVFDQMWCVFGQLHKPKFNPNFKTNPNPSPNPIACVWHD